MPRRRGYVVRHFNNRQWRPRFARARPGASPIPSRGPSSIRGSAPSSRSACQGRAIWCASMSIADDRALARRLLRAPPSSTSRRPSEFLAADSPAPHQPAPARTAALVPQPPHLRRRSHPRVAEERFLPASKNTVLQRWYRFGARPSRRHSSATLSSPRKLSSAMGTLSSTENRLRVRRWISRTICSGLAPCPSDSFLPVGPVPAPAARGAGRHALQSHRRRAARRDDRCRDLGRRPPPAVRRRDLRRGRARVVRLQGALLPRPGPVASRARGLRPALRRALQAAGVPACSHRQPPCRPMVRRNAWSTTLPIGSYPPRPSMRRIASR